LALWKLINEEDVLLFPKNPGENFSSVFTLEIFWGKVSRYAAIPLIVALYAGHSQITRFPSWSPIATGTHLFRAVFDPPSEISGSTSRRAFSYPNLHE